MSKQANQKRAIYSVWRVWTKSEKFKGVYENSQQLRLK